MVEFWLTNFSYCSNLLGFMIGRSLRLPADWVGESTLLILIILLAPSISIRRWVP
jgi:hypothetical protein